MPLAVIRDIDPVFDPVAIAVQREDRAGSERHRRRQEESNDIEGKSFLIDHEI